MTAIRSLSVRGLSRMERLSDLNAADDAQAQALVSPLIERAPHVARKVARARPFASIEALALAIRRELHGLNEAERIALFRSHPELAPDDPLSMTRESRGEQGRLDLTSADNSHRARLVELNAAYRARFGFPFITALVRHPDMTSVLGEFERRLAADRAAEIETALEQVAAVSLSRLHAAFGPSAPAGANREG